MRTRRLCLPVNSQVVVAQLTQRNSYSLCQASFLHAAMSHASV